MKYVSRAEARLKRQKRVRTKVRGTPERPRLSVFRTAKHVYAQIIDDRDGFHVFSCLLNPFADRFWNFIGLSQAVSHHPFSVSHDHNGTETEPPSALDHFGDPVNEHHLFD